MAARDGDAAPGAAAAAQQSAPKRRRVGMTWQEATQRHAFVDKGHYRCLVSHECVWRDSAGEVVFVFLKQVIPERARALATSVLQRAARRTSLRAQIYGGRSPLSGVTGYYDYAGTPVELKCRRSAFTHDHVHQWPDVFPLVEYVNECYRKVAPQKWALQNAAVPDAVRVRGSVFSTLTVNQDFRTAKHTDTGDFDAGFSCLTVAAGQYEGYLLGLPDFGVAVDVRPGDLLLFESKYAHCNTEPEAPDSNRLSVVLYYRFRLGEKECLSQILRRREELVRTDPEAAARAPPVRENNNGRNLNAPKQSRPGDLSPLAMLDAAVELADSSRSARAAYALRAAAAACPEVADVVCVRTQHAPAAKRPADAYEPQTNEELRQEYSGGLTGKKALQRDVSKPASAGDLFDDPAALEAVAGTVLKEDFEARCTDWISSVQEAWRTKNAARPDKPMSWANKGPMQEAFTALCEVAESVGEEQLGGPLAERSIEAQQRFWNTFALHAARRCVAAGLPEQAISIQKLSCKLTDYHSGGTRYFTELPNEEQERRRQRQAALRRRRETASTEPPPADTQDWLTCDLFNYQSEDRPVNYAAAELDPPERALQRLRAVPPSQLADGGAVDTSAEVGIVTVPTALRGGPPPANCAIPGGPRLVWLGPRAERGCRWHCAPGALDAVVVPPLALLLMPAEGRGDVLRAAAGALGTGGAAVVGAFSEQPQDAARLTKPAAAAAAECTRATARGLAARRGVPGVCSLLSPAALAAEMQNAGLQPVGSYHCGGKLNEYRILALKTASRDDRAG
eukprot:TRINITY_DN17758_c0_g2_i2.p1 TRINITY_DN17758_c0_g2~~TRINITY_DN17758_c0_g2_i2.p1  ORF type:complete len:819 (+),score=185.96 TRINITY_DN17758_c0_g2_i2:76-2457(+)